MLVVACPGQGAQKSGFLTPFMEIDSFKQTIASASEAVGLDLIAHGTTSDDETIKDTAIAQPLLVASAIASAREVLGDTAPSFYAGHSVGEIGAAALAGILTDSDAMNFVGVRSRGMAQASKAVPTGMAAVIGGVQDDVLAAIEAAGLQPANVNGGGQIVAAGALENIDKLKDNPPERTRVIPLQVAGAFHTDFMASAQPELQELADSLNPNDPTVSILSNRDGRPVENGREYVQSLVSQVTSPVRWDLCQQTLVESGVTGLLELLPGGTLTGIARRGMKGIETFALTSADQLDKARAFVAAHA
ncbi:ACP S-malonyltransferase [Brevibacterium ravenspurgense]|uniref:Malonyl CoA-acyl carrier protein transacylase n=1 Tax=Brevibacterium ravenspurgense TaxID=479117 RepID=A0A2I1IJK7_9MICO|nr:ACP S-malonyltransferase [Brevibacterium ravenspurgense]MCG7299930.1 ACP S-malonyltransferase [Brevibacterium ravenspurgense]PKY71301.1 ACP S-malonyltransferase [Brevibacterium ravenspurgense]